MSSIAFVACVDHVGPFLKIAAQGFYVQVGSSWASSHWSEGCLDQLGFLGKKFRSGSILWPESEARLGPFTKIYNPVVLNMLG